MPDRSPDDATPTDAQPPPKSADVKKPGRKRRVRGLGVLLAVLGTAGAVTGAAFYVRKSQPEYARRVAEWFVGPPPVWTHRPGPDPWSLRQVILADRDRALRGGDLEAAAEVNAQLSHEALLRAHAAQQAWIGLQNPKTKLFPERERDPVWEYKDGASDCYGFLVQAGVRLNPSSLQALRETLAAEIALAPPGELCHGARADTGAPLKEDDPARMFGSTEYVKDGLLSVFERYGDRPEGAPYRDRMLQVLDVILAKSAQGPGKLPGKGSEENGNILQACSRLSFSAPNGAAYADMAARIADAYVTTVMPKCNGLPIRQFDFDRGEPKQKGVRLRDHGNEIVPGLGEAYAMAVARAAANEAGWKERADRWAEPVGKMYEVLLTKALDARGMVASQVDEKDLHITAREPNDNWAYVLNGAYLYAQAARRHAAAGGGGIAAARIDAIEAAADKSAAAVAAQYGLDWEEMRMDGLADTIEGGCYIVGHRPSLAATMEPWVDDQVSLLFARQLASGVVQGDYLDGNFIRTALMYADLRSGGWTLDPWRPDVRLGFARSPDGRRGAVVVRNTGDQPYKGTIRPERHRYAEVMKLPWDWPRLNSWPEHYAPGAGDAATAPQGMPAPTAEQLKAGIPIELPANARAGFRLEIAPAR